MKNPMLVRWGMALAFFALPLVFIYVELTALKHALAEEYDTLEQTALLSSLRTLKDQQNLLGVCQDFLTIGLRRASAAASPHQDLARLQQEVPHELGLSMDFLLLSPDGTPVEGLSTIQIPKELASFLASDFDDLENPATPNDGAPAGFKARLPAYQEFFGPWIYRFGDSRKLIGIRPVRFQERRHFLYVSPKTPIGRLLALIDKPVDWELHQIRLDLARRLAESPGERGVVLTSRQTPDQLKEALAEGFETGWRASLLMGASTRQAMRIGDWLWAQVPIGPTTRVILGRPDTIQGELRNFRLLLALFFSALFVIAAGLFFRLMATPGGIPFRLSTRLFLLLAYVVGLPLLVYGLSARTLARDLDEVRQRRWHDRQVALLSELDKRFLDYVGTLEATLKSRFRLTVSGAAVEATLRQLLQKTVQEFQPAAGVYLDSSGVARFESGAESFSVPPVVQTLLFHACASILGGQPQEKEHSSGDLAAALGGDIGFNTELVTAIITEHPEVLLDCSFISSDISLLLNLVSTTNGPSAYAVLTAWEGSKLCRQFLERFLPRFQAGAGGILLASRGLNSELWAFPKSSPFSAIGDELLQGFREARRPMTLPVPVGSETWLLTGYRGSQLKGMLTMAGSPASLRENSAGKIRRRMTLIGILLLISGLITGRLLSASFLKPIRELARGVDALSRRDFTYRIPPLGRDEFGQLGSAFNQMQEDLKDLELARILQERIYPPGVTDLGNGWEVFGECRPASEVGGDFFDYFRLPDGRWFLVIGDVSGHGTPSALIVAMAKGLFAHPRNQADPGQIIRDVQTVFGQVLPRGRMMMTCFVALFEPVSGHLQFSNAGHNYPYVVDSDGNQFPLQTKGFPLGVGRKRRDVQDEIVMPEGSFLFLYTDGFIEALDHQGTAIGYEKVRERLSSVQGMPARQAVESLRMWHEEQVAPGPQADDITLMILKRADPLTAKTS